MTPNFYKTGTVTDALLSRLTNLPLRARLANTLVSWLSAYRSRARDAAGLHEQALIEAQVEKLNLVELPLTPGGLSISELARLAQKGAALPEGLSRQDLYRGLFETLKGNPPDEAQPNPHG